MRMQMRNRFSDFFYGATDDYYLRNEPDTANRFDREKPISQTGVGELDLQLCELLNFRISFCGRGFYRTEEQQRHLLHATGHEVDRSRR